jgi:STE24 endopeptidase
VLPALALSIALASFALGIAGQALSRQVEKRADTFALELTRDPDALIELQRSLALTNISDPDPPAFYQAIFGSHPTTMERIGAAIAYREERP